LERYRTNLELTSKSFAEKYNIPAKALPAFWTDYPSADTNNGYKKA